MDLIYALAAIIIAAVAIGIVAGLLGLGGSGE